MFGWRLVREWLTDLRTQQAATLPLIESLHRTIAEATTARAVAEAKAAAADQRAAQMQTSFEWLTSYVNRLEHERVLLLQRATGVTAPVPVLDHDPDAARRAEAPQIGHGIPFTDDSVMERAILDLASTTFEDVGDEEAQRLGMGHDAYGNLQVRMPA